jgi:hypothetical protein
MAGDENLNPLDVISQFQATPLKLKSNAVALTPRRSLSNSLAPYHPVVNLIDDDIVIQKKLNMDEALLSKSFSSSRTRVRSKNIVRNVPRVKLLTTLVKQSPTRAPSASKQGTALTTAIVVRPSQRPKKTLPRSSPMKSKIASSQVKRCRPETPPKVQTPNNKTPPRPSKRAADASTIFDTLVPIHTCLSFSTRNS